jgi:hypothetical protein
LKCCAFLAAFRWYLFRCGGPPSDGESGSEPVASVAGESTLLILSRLGLGLGFRGVTGVESSCDVPLGPATGSLSSSCDPTLRLPRAFRSSLGFIGFRDPAEDTGFVEVGMLGLHVPVAASASSDFLVNPPFPRFSHVRHRLRDQHLVHKLDWH